MRLSQRHQEQFFKDASTVNTICEHFFKKSPITYFDYHCFFHDGHSIVLSSNPLFVKSFVNDSLYPCLEQNKLALETVGSWVFLSENMPLPTDTKAHNRATFNKLIQCSTELEIYHKIYFVRCFDNRFLISGFGSGHHDTSVFDFYLNHLDLLEMFINYFEEKVSHLLYDAPEKLIFLPHYNTSQQTLPMKTDYSMATMFPLDEVMSNKKVFVVCGKRNIALTKKQLNCLLYSTLGYSARQVAEHLQLSPRTIEQYIEVAKDKLALHDKEAIRHLLKANGLLL